MKISSPPKTSDPKLQEFLETVYNALLRLGLVYGVGLVPNRTFTTTNYTVTSNDVIIAVTNTAAPRTIAFPSDVILAGTNIWIIKDESGGALAQNITINTVGAETIDGAATATIATNYGVVRLYSNGSNLFTW